MCRIEMNTFEGRCKYCGEIQPIIAMDQIDADEKISENCSCGGAEMERREMAVLENIKNTVGDSCTENGFTRITPEQEEIITNMALDVLRGKVKQVICKTEGTVVSVTNTAGKVKIKRIDTRNLQTEA